MNQGKNKLVIEPMLRGGGWKVTEITFDDPNKSIPAVEKVGRAKTFSKWAEVKQFADKHYGNQFRKFKE